jgi:uncharacterized protein (TIGR00255 family)
MVVSMTGFGRASGQVESCFMTVEMKSVNHRFLEISLKMPKQFLSIEDKIKKLISKFVSRGRIEVYVNLDGESLVEKSIHIDWDLLSHYVDTLHEINERFSLKDEVTLDQILSLHEGIDILEESTSSDIVEKELLHIIESAVQQLSEMRKAEGEQLSVDLQARLADMRNIGEELELVAPTVVEQYREKLTKRVFEFVTGMIDENLS